MIAPNLNTNPTYREVSPSASRCIFVLAVGRAWKCESCGGRRLIRVSPDGGEVGAIKGGDGSCLGKAEGSCMWDANRDRLELDRRVARRRL